MAGLFDFITGQTSAPARAPGLGAVPPEQPSMAARFAAGFKRRLGDAMGAIANNPIAGAAGDFANEYWGGATPAPVAAPTSAGFGVTKPDFVSPSVGMGASVSPTDMDAHRAAYDAANSAPGGFMSPGGAAPAPDKYGVLPKYDANGNLTGSEASRTGVTWNPNTGQPEGGKYAAAGGYNNYILDPTRRDYTGPDSFGAIMGRGAAGMLNIKRETGIAKQAALSAKLGAELGLGYDKIRADLGLGYDKLRVDTQLKGPGAAKDAAQAAKETMAARIAARLADPATPEDERERLKLAAGALVGRFPTDAGVANFQSMNGNDIISAPKSGRGAVTIQTPIRPVTAANIDAALTGSMKGKTRAQVIQAYKDKGYDVSGIK